MRRWIDRCARLIPLLGLAVLAPVLLTSLGVVPVARFERERIDIRVRSDSIDVDGLYVYRNTLPLPWVQGLSVPFAVSDTQTPPATVEASLVDPASGGELRELPVRWILGVPRLEVPLPAGGAAHVRIRFSQRATTGTATYLLTTTAPWGRPLERGEYVLHPAGVRIVANNLAPDGGTESSVVREWFMPDCDWTFRWRMP